ncbi:MAG TPA: hypothetical protein VK034_30705 [Enhygromyxa sp.]|nr:hypothetical protein [Enhygromyxa sp.]
MDDAWPTTPSPSWPSNCLIENVAVHPSQPWLAVACTDAENQRGAVLVFDAQAGSLRSATVFEDYVGWSEQSGLLRWHPDGRRLATNVTTNGIALLDRARIVGYAYPDETRDSGVRYVWVDESRMFSDTGALFEIREGEGLFEFEELGSPFFDQLEWNAAIGAAVGRVGAGIAAFDPVSRRLVYHHTLDHLASAHRMYWSDDGRWCARLHWGTPPASDEIVIFDGDDGRLAYTLVPSRPRFDELRWGREGALLVRSHGPDAKTSNLDIVRGGHIETTIELGPRLIQASRGVPEASGLAWSPDGRGLALLLDGQEIQLRDASSGLALSSFSAPAPAIPDGLPDYYRHGHQPDYGITGDLIWLGPQRLVRLAPHFVGFWSIDGQQIAQFVVPTEPG